MKAKKNVVAAAVFGAAMAVGGCGAAGGIACKVIDLADTTCPLIVQFASEDGGPKQQLEISNQDAKEMAAAKAARAARDAGK